MSVLANPRVEIGLRLVDDPTFVPILGPLCLLCAREIDRRDRRPIAIIPCCAQAVHMECATARFDARAGCPTCWADSAGYGRPEMFTREFLQQMHSFFLDGNWYHRFAAEGVAVSAFVGLAEIGGHLEAFQSAMQSHAPTICKMLLDAGKFEHLLRATKCSVETLDLFYDTLCEEPFVAQDVVTWQGLLMAASEQPCRAGSAFNLVFRVLGGDAAVGVLSHMSADKLRNMGVAYPQLVQIRWRPGLPPHIPREHYKMLGIPTNLPHC